MRRFRFTKIVATLGPSSSSPEMIEKLFYAGVDVFRLNFSHGSHEDHRNRFQAIRNLEKKVGRPTCILLDLQGPKLRIGTFENGPIELEKGQSFLLKLDPVSGSQQEVTLPHPEIFQALVSGTDLLLDDGKIHLRVQECSSTHALTEVITGGPLSDRKGLNIPGVPLKISPLTPKDKEDLAFGLELGVDWVALSFVQRPEDVMEARELIQDKAAIISKLEKPQAIEHLEKIVELSDGIMVARGDLGVEMPTEDVPILQKRIVRESRLQGKPVVVATQMLDSMVHAPAPTRAEASDVATAVYDGADAVMLSAESASGDYPVESVEIMSRIITRVEHDPLYRRMMEVSHSEPEPTTSDAITLAAAQIAHTIGAAAIVTFTATGGTTLRAARERPECPIIGITRNPEIARQLAIVWGVHALENRQAHDFEEATHLGCHQALAQEFAKLNDRVVITAGVPFNVEGSTNVLRIGRIRDVHVKSNG